MVPLVYASPMDNRTAHRVAELTALAAAALLLLATAYVLWSRYHG